MPVETRVQRILADYDYWIQRPSELKGNLGRLKSRYGQKVLDEWNALIDGGQWAELVERLLLEHYDVGYTMSLARREKEVKNACFGSHASLSLGHSITLLCRTLPTEPRHVIFFVGLD